jgi:HEAT repeat protein
MTAAVPALVERALHDPATQVRIAAVHALAASDAPHLSVVAESMMREADPDLAAAALTALAAVDGPHVDEQLADAARSPDLARRVPAVQALASRPRRLSAELLAWAARVGEPRELSGIAIDGLRRLAQGPAADSTTAAVEALLSLAAERPTREEALAALSTLPDTAVAPIADALATGRLNVRLAAVEALARLRHRRASDALAHALQDPVAAVRSAAVAAFGRLGTVGAGPMIASIQEHDPDEGVRRRAAAVCARHDWSQQGAK